MRYIDTHAHLNLPAFSDDVLSVVALCEAKEVGVINIGTTAETSAKAVDLALLHRNLYAMIGLHPIQTAPTVPAEADGRGGTPSPVTPEVFVEDLFSELYIRSQGKVVGVGECGFDYFHTLPGSYAVQEAAFIAQIEFANRHNLPLMIHTRGPKPGEASPTGRSVYADVYEVLKTYARVPFNVHFYAGTYEEAKCFFEIGGTISFTGVITFARAYEDIIKAVPLTLMHGETDCPYVAPVPYRGKRCEPWMVEEVYKTIATIRGEDEEEVRLQLLENAKKLYLAIA
jgi:TatD DNase family protein